MAGGGVIGVFPCCGRWPSAAWGPWPGRYARLWAIEVKLTDWRRGLVQVGRAGVLWPSAVERLEERFAEAGERRAIALQKK